MSFYDRYIAACELRGMKPQSTETLEATGLAKGSVTSWKKKGFAPTGTRLAKIADGLRVSTDYLLERTDDPTDYVPIINEEAESIVDQLAMYHKYRSVIKVFERLDQEDRNKIIGVAQGILLSDKYGDR